MLETFIFPAPLFVFTANTSLAHDVTVRAEPTSVMYSLDIMCTGRVKGQNNKEMISTKPDKSTEIEACARKVAGREFEIHLHTNPPLAAIYDSQASMFL